MNTDDKAATLKRVGEETMRFMRGKYVLDEVGNGKDELKFRRGGKTVLTIYIRDGRYDFLIIFGKAEREKFDLTRDEFPQAIRDIYDSSKTYHDGKWMLFPVADLDALEAVKQMIVIKKKPNRKPFNKEGAIYSKCGMRCDLCAHYCGHSDDEFRKKLIESADRIYNGGASRPYDDCPGCMEQAAGKPHPCMDGDSCEPLRCAKGRRLENCHECAEYPCDKAVAGYRAGIEAKSLSSGDVTWGILPYVDWQYGN